MDVRYSIRVHTYGLAAEQWRRDGRRYRAEFADMVRRRCAQAGVVRPAMLRRRAITRASGVADYRRPFIGSIRTPRLNNAMRGRKAVGTPILRAGPVLSPAMFRGIRESDWYGGRIDGTTGCIYAAPTRRLLRLLYNGSRIVHALLWWKQHPPEPRQPASGFPFLLMLSAFRLR